MSKVVSEHRFNFKVNFSKKRENLLSIFTILSFGKDQKNVVPRLYRSQDGVLKTSIVSLRVRSAAMKMASDKSSRVPFSPSFKELFP